jgi:hypothetical protein
MKYPPVILEKLKLNKNKNKIKLIWASGHQVFW